MTRERVMYGGFSLLDHSLLWIKSGMGVVVVVAGGVGVGESKLFSRIKRLVNIREAFYSSVKLTLLYPCYSKGKDGDPGTPGTPGKDGEMGLQGERGAAGTHGIRGATVKFSLFVL